MSQRGSSRRDSVVSSLEEKQKQRGKDKERISHAETDKHKQKSEKERADHFEKEFSNFKTEFKELFKLFDDRMDKKLTKIDEKFTNVFDELKREISSVRLEVYDTKEEVKELKSKVTELESSVNFQAETQEEFSDLQDTKFCKMNYEINEMRKKLLTLEKQERKYNLLFYGFTEEKNENLGQTMKSFFKDTLEINKEAVDDMRFVNCHLTPFDGEGPKPIIIRFQSFEDRELVYSKFLMPVLRDQRKRILTDLPVEMKRTRAMLAKEAYKIRKSEGMKTRIVEKGLSVTVTLEVRKSAEDSWERREIN